MVAFVSMIIAGCSSNPSSSGNNDALAKCLAEKGVTMYGASWCPHCQAQKKLFGDSFQYINYVECSNDQNPQAESQQCQDANISGYPTWIINGAQYPGEQTFYDLAKNAGCLGNITG